MKVLSKFNSFITVYCCEPSIFSSKKCRIQIQILHFITDKYKFNKLFQFLAFFNFKYSLSEHIRQQISERKYFILLR